MQEQNNKRLNVYDNRLRSNIKNKEKITEPVSRYNQNHSVSFLKHFWADYPGLTFFLWYTKIEAIKKKHRTVTNSSKEYEQKEVLT